MGTYFTADTHFRHNNIIRFEDRPFLSLEDMEDTIAERWNNTVSDDDTIYIVGDFVFGGYTRWVEVLEKLNGKKILIEGNHDNSKVTKRLLQEGYFQELHEVGIKMKVQGYTLWLSHYPMEIGIRPSKYSIHGHIHSLPSTLLNQVNVGVDSPHLKHVPFGQPISLEQLVEILDEREPKVIELFNSNDNE